MVPLAPWATKCTQGFAPQLLHPPYVFHMRYSTDSLLQALGLSDSWGSAHTPLSQNPLTKQMRRQFIFSIINFFFIVVKTLQESNTGWYTMPTATRQTSRSKKRDTSNFLLHFSCGTYTSQQAFNDVPRSLKPQQFSFYCNRFPMKFTSSKKRCQSSYKEKTSWERAQLSDLQINCPILVVLIFRFKISFQCWVWTGLIGTQVLSLLGFSIRKLPEHNLVFWILWCSQSITAWEEQLTPELSKSDVHKAKGKKAPGMKEEPPARKIKE